MQEINPGVHVLNDKPPEAEMTIAVTGAGRSGTTMVSRVLTACGIFMGDHLSPQSHEDRDIRDALQARDHVKFAEICATRNAKWPVWGFKNPGFRSHMGNIYSIMRNPRLVVTLRDPLAIAKRNNISVGVDVMAGLMSAARTQKRLIETLQKIECPILLVSYEKALQSPDQIAAAIAEFCGRPPAEAGSVIRANDPLYLGRADDNAQTEAVLAEQES